MKKSTIYLVLTALFSFLLFENCVFASQPEIIYEHKQNYTNNFKFSNIGNLTYFFDHDYEKNWLLWQSDGTKSGTIPVIAKNSFGEEINIVNPFQVFSKSNKLVLITVLNNYKYLSIYNPLNQNYKILDSVKNENLYYGLNFRDIDSNIIMLYKGSLNSPSDTLCFINISTEKINQIIYPNINSIAEADSLKIIFRGDDGKLTLLNSATQTTLWEMNGKDLKAFYYYIKQTGILLNNLDSTKKSLFIHYIDGKVDTIATFVIPSNLKSVDLEHKIFSVFDSTTHYNWLVKTNVNYQIIDTISKNGGSVTGNNLYYSIPSKIRINKTYYEVLLSDLYSYNLNSGKKELLVSDCVSMGGSYNDYHTFKDGKFIIRLMTQKYGRELYITDGTASGTKLIKDINKGPSSTIDNESYTGMIKNSSLNLYYFQVMSDIYGNSLWQTDGTEENTIPILSYEPANGNPELNKNDNFYINNGKIFIAHSHLLYSFPISKINELVKPNNYKIFDNIFSQSLNTSDPSNPFYQANIFKDKENNIYVSGIQNNYSNHFGLNYQKNKSYDTLTKGYSLLGYIIKYNPKGLKLFTRYINCEMQFQNLFNAVDSSGNIYCLYPHYSTIWDKEEYIGLLKMNSNGDSLWLKKFGSVQDDELKGLQIDKEGDIYVLLHSRNLTIRIIKINSEGNFINTQKINQKTDFNKADISIINDKIYIALSEMCERFEYSCKYRNFLNKIYLIDLSLNILNEISYLGDDYNYVTSINKGFGDDIVITGTFRGKLDLFGNIINSDKLKDCNLQTSYFAHFDSDLNLKYFKNLNPEPYIINSAFLKKNFDLYTVGICSNCPIDSIQYPNLYGYPNYSNSVATKQYDYWGNEIASFYYSKHHEDYWNQFQPKVIEYNGEPLVYDVYQRNLGYIPDAYFGNYYQDKMILLQPVLYSIQNYQNFQKRTKYDIISDINGNYFVQSNDSLITNNKIDISVFDLVGKCLFSQSLTLINGSQRLILPDYIPNGCYLITIKDEKVIEQHKIMK